MNNLSKTFCPLPWIHLATRPNGDVRVCCTANASGAGLIDNKHAGLVMQDGVAMNLRDHTIEEVWNSEAMKQTRLQMLAGQVPISCQKCFNEEANGIQSKRQWETMVWKERLDIGDIVSKTGTDGSLPVNVPYFDLRLGNMCQLKCVMCSPHDSSSWIKDWKLQYPKYKTVELCQDQNWDRTFDYTWYQKGSFLDTMKSQANYIKELYFAGGEPLLIPEHYKILEYMVETGASKNCVLRYNSNGVELPSQLFQLWKEFKQVKFNFSIDAVGLKNNYIRYPSEWNNIVQNLHVLDTTPDNVTVNIACAVQLLNVLYLPELASWKMSKQFKKINLPPYGAGVIGTHLVYLPSYLNIRVLPPELKQLAADRIQDFCKEMSNNQQFMTSQYGYQRWQGIIRYMLQEDWSSKLDSTVEYLEICDKTRNLNFREVFEDLKIL
jgi:MoaA/NifB/PqqE/SkfB family radical SAM enzyme